MKKKILAIVLSVFAAVLLVGAFAGCSSETQAAGAGTSTTVSITLNKKYISGEDISDPESDQKYFIFTSAEKGKYHNYLGSGDRCNAYTVHFRYKIAGDMDYMFYDAVEYDAADTTKSVDSTWTMCLAADTDFLIHDGGSVFVCEDFLGEIPNFGK